MTDSPAPERRRRNPAPWILAAAIAVLAVYYTIVSRRARTT